jgi:membrane protein implicated in regulation of membrane protease activity
MSRHDENPTAGEMLEEILDLLAGLGVLLLPISLLAVPGLVLLLPLLLLAIPFALLAAPVVLILALRRRLGARPRRRREASQRISVDDRVPAGMS